MTYKFDCRLFTGYKPCKFKRSCDGCSEYQPVGKRIAIVSLEALGAVLRSTVLLPPIKRKYPDAHITWITYKNAMPVLENNSMIDRVIPVTEKTLSILNHLKFDVLYAVDKSLEAGALAEQIDATSKYGFGLKKSGVIYPFSEEGSYQYQVGLDDDLKFFKNEKTETQQITESMGLEWKRDEYVLDLTDEEKRKVVEFRNEMFPKGTKIIGFNTGCSLLYSYKKLPVERCVELVKMWRSKFSDCGVALFGGPEDTKRNEEIMSHFVNDPMVVGTPTTGGLRTGIVWMGIADIMFSGCSLGLHISIALKKPTIVWFGVSCAQEIDLYEKGVKIRSKVDCSPCWKRKCDNEPKCYNRVSLEEIHDATKTLLEGNF